MAARVWALVVARRHLLLALWALGWFGFAFAPAEHAFNDWQFFEYGARVVVHLDRHYPGGALHVYADYPFIQIGPPALLLVAALQWLPPHVVALVCGLAMTLAGGVALHCLEVAAVRLRPDVGARIRPVATTGGLLLLAAWGAGVGRFRHLDDVLALTCVAVAVRCCASGRRWWLAGVLVGTAAAAKPWALVLAPVLLALPRRHRAPAAVVAVVACAAWWLPFVVADPRTVSALGGFAPHVDAGSALHALGVRGLTPVWVHPVQVGAGFVAGCVVALRGRWYAAPLAALAARVLVDPQVWSYYGMAVLLAAATADLVGGRRRLPLCTLVATVALYTVPAVAPAAVTGWVRVLWAVGTLGWLSVGLARPSRLAGGRVAGVGLGERGLHHGQEGVVLLR
jgi:hypothetical protein